MVYDNEIVVRRLAAIVESSDDAIVAKDLHSIITDWNPAAERIFGFSDQEMIGSSILKIIPVDRHNEEEEILSRIRRGERVDHFETIRLRKDGQSLHVSISVAPIKDSSGNIIGASKIARDVSERIAAAFKLEQAALERQALFERERIARAEAETANRMKDEFLATLSHELRTPLNAILGWAILLKSGELTEEELQGAAETIERNARAQAQIIEDLLDLSSITSGKVRLEAQPFQISEVLRDAIDTVRTAADAKNIQLQTIPEDSDCVVIGDTNRLRQVFWNLLANAVKFTPENGKIEVMLERVHSHIQIKVIDSGEGIDPAFLPFVFNRFQQANASTSRKHGGLGIGLALVKQLIELHGGNVEARSLGLGQGATFVLRLPLAPVQAQHACNELEKVRPLSEFSLQDVTVLVVDDEVDARNFVKRLLETNGARVLLAGNAADAMETLLRNQVDLLISDIGMPTEDGFTLLNRIRQLPDPEKRNVSAVALTAYARREDRNQAIRSGFQNHLPKPVEPSELLAVVKILTRPNSNQSVPNQ